MKDNGYKDKLLYIKNRSRCEENKSRIDFIMKMIDDVGLDKINDITVDNNEAIVLFRHNIIEPEKIIYNKLTNTLQGYFILESHLAFKLSSQKLDISHWFNHKTSKYYLQIYSQKYYNQYRVSKNKFKNTVLHKNINSGAFNMEIPDYLNYIYNISENIKKELMGLKIPKKNVLDFIKNDYTRIAIEEEHNKRIKLINNFFNINKFLTKDNIYDFREYGYEYHVPYIILFVNKIFDSFLSKFD